MDLKRLVEAMPSSFEYFHAFRCIRRVKISVEMHLKKTEICRELKFAAIQSSSHRHLSSDNRDNTGFDMRCAKGAMLLSAPQHYLNIS